MSDRFDFVKDRQYGGCKFRLGLFEINAHDLGLIAQAMGVDACELLF